ncbi:hypothetical protein LguiB_018339 [Lonicera macranthoides]
MTIAIAMLLLNLCTLVPMAMSRIGNSTISSSSSRPSVVNVGALFSMNSVIGRSVKPALAAAIEDVNSDSSVLGGTQLNLISYDTNCTGFLGVMEGNSVGMMSLCADMAVRQEMRSSPQAVQIGFLRYHGFHYWSRWSKALVEIIASTTLELIEKNVVAVIGPQSSGLAHVISHVANEVNVPLLSFGATDPTLSSLQYPYFIRTTQSDYFQMNAIADLVEYYMWKEVTAIYVDNEYGRNGISVLGDALAKKRARISYKAAFAPGAPKNEIHDYLVELNLTETRVYVVHADPDSGLTVFSVAKYLRMMTNGYVWIATDWLSSVLDSSVDTDKMDDLLQGVIAVCHHTPGSNIKKSFTTKWKNLNSYALYAYDSVWLLARALDVFFSEGGNITFSSNPRLRDTNGGALHFTSLPIFDEGQRLLQILITMKFIGLRGKIQFDKGKNLIHPAYDVLNIGGTGSRRIGYWSNQSGLSVIPPEILNVKPLNASTRNQNLYGVIWPGESAIQPRGWVFPNDGNTLRIAVPSDDHMGVTRYCIDVFEAALSLLPYTVPHVYMPYGNNLRNYNNMLRDIAQNVSIHKKYDAGVGDITIFTKRLRTVDFTVAYMESELVIVARVEKVSPTTWAFLKPFTVEMWCVTGAAFVFVGTVIWILEHQVNREFHVPPRQRLITILWFSFSTMVFAHRQDTVSTLGRLVMMLWLFVVLIINSSYTASLSSILTTQQLTSHIGGIDNLKSSSYPIGVQDGSFAYDYLNQDLNIPQYRLKILKNQEDYVEALRRGPQDDGVAVIVDELPYVEMLLSSNNCEYRTVGQAFKKISWGFAFQRDSHLVVDLSTAILQLSENGSRDDNSVNNSHSDIELIYSHRDDSVNNSDSSVELMDGSVNNSNSGVELMHGSVNNSDSGVELMYSHRPGRFC